jgi:hypothetical protein
MLTGQSMIDQKSCLATLSSKFSESFANGSVCPLGIPFKVETVYKSSLVFTFYHVLLCSLYMYAGTHMQEERCGYPEILWISLEDVCNCVCVEPFDQPERNVEAY